MYSQFTNNENDPTNKNHENSFPTISHIFLWELRELIRKDFSISSPSYVRTLVFTKSKWPYMNNAVPIVRSSTFVKDVETCTVNDKEESIPNMAETTTG